MSKEIIIYFRDNLVGRIKNVSSDMWYIEGEWIAENNYAGSVFSELMRQQNFKDNFENSKGKLIKWTEGESLHQMNGLALAIVDEVFTFRMLPQDETVELLRKNEDYL